MQELIQCIRELNVDIPLCLNNRHHSIKFDFENISFNQAKQIVGEVFSLIFLDEKFWVCEFGCDSADKTVIKNLVCHPNHECYVIPFFSKLDKDWFEYRDNAIICTNISLPDLMFDRYVNHVFSKDYLSNTLFLISGKRKVVCYVYDRRGMDIASSSYALLQKLVSKFSPYISYIPTRITY